MELTDLPTEILLYVRTLLSSSQLLESGCASWPNCQWPAKSKQHRFCSACNLMQSHLKPFSMTCKSIRALCLPILFRTIWFPDDWSRQRLMKGFDSAGNNPICGLYTQRLVICCMLNKYSPDDEEPLGRLTKLKRKLFGKPRSLPPKDWFCQALCSLIEQLPQLRELGLITSMSIKIDLEHYIKDHDINFPKLERLCVSGDLQFMLSACPQVHTVDFLSTAPFKHQLLLRHDVRMDSLRECLPNIQHLGLPSSSDLSNNLQVFGHHMRHIKSIALTRDLGQMPYWNRAVFQALSRMELTTLRLGACDDSPTIIRPQAHEIFRAIPSLVYLWLGESFCYTVDDEERTVVNSRQQTVHSMSTERMLLGMSVFAVGKADKQFELVTRADMAGDRHGNVEFSPSGLQQAGVSWSRGLGSALLWLVPQLDRSVPESS